MARTRGWTMMVTLAVGTACAHPPRPHFDPAVTLALPDPAAVDAVVFLVGDVGHALEETSPLVRRLRQDVELWSGQLTRDSAVTVLFLGDNVYPAGMRDRNDGAFPRDSARLWSQVDVMSGPLARSRGASGIFLPGNHDWGNLSGPRGLQRLRNEAALLDSARARGIPVRMLPSPGDPDPATLDLRDDVRLLLLDTPWFFQEGDAAHRSDFLDRVHEAMEDAGDRHVIVAAHHPWESAGPHGRLADPARGLGILWLLKKSGALVQDLNSSVYRELLDGMRATFRDVGRPPLIWAGGHDHSLQVSAPPTPWGPAAVLVSGAGSNLTGLTTSPLLHYAAHAPGYMMLVLRSDAALDLYVLASPRTEPLVCPVEPGETLAACMDREEARIGLVYSERLVPAAPSDGSGA